MARAGIFASNGGKKRLVDRALMSTPAASNRDNCNIDKELARSATVPVVSLAKNFEEVFEPNSIYPINDSPDTAALLLLRSLRDESHRFALSNHRQRRSKINGLK
mmetsp:Transcript_35214/g.59779  ORF Transcript_35214/g.59779 Transcript_35214/m.59779 type:complete len:105 (-) Transcript_35214:90-404(-)